jgi:hypothetical protein
VQTPCHTNVSANGPVTLLENYVMKNLKKILPAFLQGENERFL